MAENTTLLKENMDSREWDKRAISHSKAVKVTLADGTVQDYASSRFAAAGLGVSPTTVSVALKSGRLIKGARVELDSDADEPKIRCRHKIEKTVPKNDSKPKEKRAYVKKADNEPLLAPGEQIVMIGKHGERAVFQDMNSAALALDETHGDIEIAIRDGIGLNGRGICLDIVPAEIAGKAMERAKKEASRESSSVSSPVPALPFLEGVNRQAFAESFTHLADLMDRLDTCTMAMPIDVTQALIEARRLTVKAIWDAVIDIIDPRELARMIAIQGGPS